MAKHLKKWVKWPYVFLFLLTTVGVVWANWQGDFIKANMTVDGVDVTVNRDLTVARNLTVTGTSTITGAIGSSGITLSNGEKILNTTDSQIINQYDDDAVELGSLTLKSTNTSVAANDYIEIGAEFPDSAGNNTPYGLIRLVGTSVTNSSETGAVYLIGTGTAGAVTNYAIVSNSAIIPNSSNSMALGSTTNEFGYVYANILALGTSQLQNFVSESSGASMYQLTKDGTTLGSFTIYGADADPSDSDTIEFIMSGGDSLDNETDYYNVSVVADDVTDATEDSTVNFINLVAGTPTTNLSLGANGVTVTNLLRTGRKMLCNSGFFAGANAGFVVSGTDSNAPTLAAGDTGTLVLPVSGIPMGATITDMKIVGQIESAGNTATLDAQFRKQVAVAADITDTAIASITQLNVTADTKVESSVTFVTPEVVAEDEQYYILITGTTAAATDMVIMGAVITFNEAD